MVRNEELEKELKREKKRYRKIAGVNLNRELARLGYSNQSEVARLCGLPRQTVNKLINGKTSFDAWIVFKLGKIGVKPRNLFLYSGNDKDIDQEDNMNKSLGEYPVDYILDNPNIIIEEMRNLSKHEKFERLMSLIRFCLSEISKLNYAN